MKPAVFLDRDGVICEYVEELNEVKLFKLRVGVGSAIRRINEAGYWVFVVTNQPMIAKGKMTLERNAEIHELMESLVGKYGAHFDKIYFCPHRVGGVVAEYAFDCACRKPKAGMLEQAATEFTIDFSRSIMIGDTWRDVECARRFGIQIYAVTGGGGYPYPPDSKDALYVPDKLFDGLPAAVAHLLA